MMRSGRYLSGACACVKGSTREVRVMLHANCRRDVVFSISRSIMVREAGTIDDALPRPHGGGGHADELSRRTERLFGAVEW